MDKVIYSAETWRAIEQAPDYEVSSLGSVRIGARILKQTQMPTGYMQVRLRNGGAAKTYYVHRLVALAFHGPQPSKSQNHVAHGNGQKADNRADNLRWASAAQNSADRWVHGTMHIGQANHAAKLSDGDREAIRVSDEPGIVIAQRYGISQSCVVAIRGRRRAPNARSRAEAIAAKRVM